MRWSLHPFPSVAFGGSECSPNAYRLSVGQCAVKRSSPGGHPIGWFALDLCPSHMQLRRSKNRKGGYLGCTNTCPILLPEVRRLEVDSTRAPFTVSSVERSSPPPPRRFAKHLSAFDCRILPLQIDHRLDESNCEWMPLFGCTKLSTRSWNGF